MDKITEIENALALFDIGLSSIGKKTNDPLNEFETTAKQLINGLEKILFEPIENKREALDEVLRNALFSSPNPELICKYFNNKAKNVFKKLNEVSSIVHLQNNKTKEGLLFELELLFHALFFEALNVSSEHDTSFVYTPNIQIIGNLKEIFEDKFYKDFEAHFQHNKAYELEDELFAYTSQLAYLLSAKFVNKEKPHYDYDSKLLLHSYKLGYSKGVLYFKENYSNIKDYASSILHNYNSFNDGFVSEGWKDIKRMHPAINFNSEQAFKYGYYSGLVFMAENAFNNYSDIFKTLAQQPKLIVEQKPKLKIDRIALKFVYEGLQITRKNGNEIAKQYGHNSGEKLFQRFTYFSSAANRKGKPNLCTPKKLDNKIKLIESVIELLPTDKQERAKDEVSILKKIYEAEYQ